MGIDHRLSGSAPTRRSEKTGLGRTIERRDDGQRTGRIASP
ncbi:MAG: hypothetical protein ACI944_002559 [Natronomonas sp.]